MVKIYFIRHGQSVANEKDIFLGQHNLDLTELGKKQAKIVANYLKDIKVDQIYSSDLTRAYHTAEQTAKLINMPIITDMGLREIDGGLWEEIEFAKLKTLYPKNFNLFVNDLGNASVEGGESIMQMHERFYNTVKNIAENSEDKNLFIFTHATVIRCFSAMISGAGKDGIQKFAWPSNTSVTEVDYENGEFKLIKYSYDEFMGDLITTLSDKV